MTFGRLFVHMYLMMSGKAGPSRRHVESSSSWPKGRTQVGESSSAVNYSREKKDLYFYSFSIQSGIHEQSLGHEDYDVVDGFSGYLKAQGWLSAFTNLRPKVTMTLIAKFYHCTNRQSLTCVQRLVNGCQFILLADDVADYLSVSNE